MKNEIPKPPTSTTAKAEGFSINNVPAASPLNTPPGQSPRWIRTGDPIPIPSALRSDPFSSATWASSHDSQANFAAPPSWKTPSSWGGVSVAFNDEASLLGDDQSDRGTDVDSSATLSYAHKRRLLRKLSKSSLSTAASRHTLAVRYNWTKKLEDFREYEVGIFKSLLPLKAGFGAALAACVCFSTFVPELLTMYGTVAVLGVGMSLESNVGLTLQKGYNLMLGSALAGACALVVSLVEPHTGSFRVYYLITCVFLGGFLPRLITLPAIIKTRWAQTLTFYISVFHGLVLNKSIKMTYTFQFFLNCLCYSFGFCIVLFLTLCVKPDYAGDALLVLLVSDFHTAGVVLERIVEDYRTGVVLTKIQELLSGVVTEDHIHHDLQYIMKSTSEVEKLMGAVKWEPSHGKFFNGYPWDLYPTLLAMLLHVMYDLISLDSALRAEVQAPLHIRQIFADEMETVARECSMLFHKVGDALQEHKKNDYHVNVERAKRATINLRTKLSWASSMVIAEDAIQQSNSCQISRIASRNSIQECLEEPVSPEGTLTPPSSPLQENRECEHDAHAFPKFAIEENDWRSRLFLRRQSIGEHWEETQQQISSLSLIKFASILIELMAKVKIVVSMVDEISVKARFADATS